MFFFPTMLLGGSGTHLALTILGMNVIKITDMDYFSFMKQHGMLDFTVLLDDSACKNVDFKVKVISKHPYLCLCFTI